MKNKFWSNKEKFIRENYGDSIDLDANSGIVSYLQIPAELENLYDKDFGEFNSDEVMNVLNYMYTTSDDLVTTILSCFRKYHDWALKVEMNKTKINAVSMIDTKVAIDIVVDHNEFYKSIIKEDFLYKLIELLEHEGHEKFKKMLKKKEILELNDAETRMFNRLEESKITFKVNNQDIISLLLAFEGVCGKSSKEICDLEWSDIDFENKKINIIDKETGEFLRSVSVTDALINILKEMKKETIYFHHISDRYGMSKQYYEFEDNDYVIKRIISTNTSSAAVTNVYLTKRIQMLKNDVFMLDLPEKNMVDYLNIQQCKLSGQIYKLNKIYDEFKNEGLTNEKIKNKFKIEKIYEKVKLIWGETSNIYPLKNKFEKYMLLKEKHS